MTHLERMPQSELPSYAHNRHGAVVAGWYELSDDGEQQILAEHFTMQSGRRLTLRTGEEG